MPTDEHFDEAAFEAELRAELGLTDAALDLDREADEDDEVLRDPDVVAMQARGSFAERQRAFERKVAAAAARATELPQLIEQIEGRAEDTYLAVTVGGRGALRSISFRPSARGAAPERLNDSFATVYAAATRDAAEQLSATLADLRGDSGA